MTDEISEVSSGCEDENDPNTKNSSHDCSSPAAFHENDEFELLNLPHITVDELPIFRISSLSPSARSLSPISIAEDQIFESRSIYNNMDDPDFETDFSCDEFTSLDDIHAQIGTPSSDCSESKIVNLETIFEGVFLDTPPKRKLNTAYVLLARRNLNGCLYSKDVYAEDESLELADGFRKKLKMNE